MNPILYVREALDIRGEGIGSLGCAGSKTVGGYLFTSKSITNHFA